MTSLNRTVRCSNCSTDAMLSLSSDMDLKELTFAGRCSRCGATLQINFNIISGPQTANQQSSESTPFSTSSTEQPSENQGSEVNLDENIFGSVSPSPSSTDSDSSFSDSDSSGGEPENVSDALKDLMEA